MSASILLEQAVRYVRSQFTKAEVVTVEQYGGQFSSDEVGQVSYNCPAIFMTVLGWKPAGEGKRLGGRYANEVRVAAFVAYKDATNRNKRMRGAMVIAEKLALVMRQWAPARDPVIDALPVTLAGLEDDATCENLYSQGMDKKGQALWLVDWTQCTKSNVPPEQLYDLLLVDITNNTHGGDIPAVPDAGGAALPVIDGVVFVSNVPPNQNNT